MYTYTPLPIETQHQVINSYSLAFLNAHLRPGVAASSELGADYLLKNHFGDEIVWL